MTDDASTTSRLTHAQLLQLRRLTTPTVYNGWEQITSRDAAADAFNLEEVRDFMPQLGPMVGYAVTAVVQVSDASRRQTNAQAWGEFRRYVAGLPGPKIVIVQDLDKPAVIGSIWGEVSAATYQAMGCVGTITDGGVRDLEEMSRVGFKALALRLCVGHGHGALIRWGCEVSVFGRTIQPEQLIHADQHGFLAIPPEDERHLLEAAQFMDSTESALTATARDAWCTTPHECLGKIDRVIASFGKAVRKRFGRTGEW